LNKSIKVAIKATRKPLIFLYIRRNIAKFHSEVEAPKIVALKNTKYLIFPLSQNDLLVRQNVLD